MYKRTTEFYAPTNRGFSRKPYKVTEEVVCFGLDDDVCEYEDGKDVDVYMDAMGLSPVTKAAYHDARGDFLRMADEKDWY